MGANRCVVKTITNPAAQLLETTHVHVQEQHHQYHPLEITQPHCRYQAYLKKTHYRKRMMFDLRHRIIPSRNTTHLLCYCTPDFQVVCHQRADAEGKHAHNI